MAITPGMLVAASGLAAVLTCVAARASAQIVVTPDGGSATAPGNTTGNTVSFTIRNDGTLAETVALSCARSGSVSSCSTGSWPTIPGGQSVNTTVTFSTGAAGSGDLSLTANGDFTSDQGSYAVTVTGSGPAADTAGVTVTQPPGAVPTFLGPNLPASRNFIVKNVGNATATFSLEALCSGAATACVPSATSLQLAAGDSAVVTVTFSSGGAPFEANMAGMIGIITLVARHTTDRVEDVGLAYLLETATAESGMRVVVDATNPAGIIARDQCVSVAAVRGIAWECWDLKVVHPLPSTRTFNQERTPLLIYNSQHAHPRPTIVAAVMLPSGAGATDSILAKLTVNGVVRVPRQKWPGSLFPTNGGTRLITLTYDAHNDDTNLYSYTVEVTRYATGGGQEIKTVTRELAIVNRKNSSFGAGWWLAGLEQLLPLSGRKLWIGGDGSTRVYVPSLDPGKWVAQTMTYPDTLREELDGGFTRLLPAGASVRFNAWGQHVATRNRLGHETTFAYPTPQLDAELQSVQLPVPGGTPARDYTFSYTAGTLSAVNAPTVTVDGVITPRVTLFQGTGQITRIEVPDGSHFEFQYDPVVTNRMIERLDRRHVKSTFAYDTAGKLAQVTLFKHQQPTTPESRWSVQTIEANGTTGVSDFFALFNGSRDSTDVNDITKFYQNRYGAPTSIFQDGFTVPKRTNPHFPGVVTLLGGPEVTPGVRPRLQHASLNARGAPIAVTEVDPYGDLKNATTRYEYDNSNWPDFVTRIVPPLKDSVVIAYDSTGNRDWQQDARGSSTRVNFSYQGQGLLQSMDGPLAAPEQFSYDLYGNLAQTISPMGFITDHHKDNVGRDTLIVTPTATAQTSANKQKYRIRYDIMGRVDSTVTTAPDTLGSSTHAALYVRNEYDDEGNLTAVSRWSSPDPGGIGMITTRWQHDAANRPLVEIAPDPTPGDLSNNPKDSTVYDPAGNAIKVITRRGHTIDMKYDHRNRLVSRITQGFVVPQWNNAGIPVYMANKGLPYAFTSPYPMHPDGAGGYPINADTAVYMHDKAGNLLTANNRDARVSRTYYRNGQLKTETQRIRTLAELSAGGDTITHAYTLTYTYDRNGRRRELQHPANLAPVVSGIIKDRTRYDYHPFGELSKVTDVLGHEYRYTYDLRAAVDSVLLPKGFNERFTYDEDGHLKTQVVRNAVGAFVRNLTLHYDGRGRMVELAGQPDTLRSTYSGLGHLVRSSRVAYSGGWKDAVHETFTTDALGNLLTTFTADTLRLNGNLHEITRRFQSSSYEPFTARLNGTHLDNPVVVSDTTWYDMAGNGTFTYQRVFNSTAALQDRASFYDAENRLRAADFRRYDNVGLIMGPYRATFEEYRYDALGRRVWVRARRMCGHDTDDWIMLECQQQHIRRTVWDGERELWEIQMPGEDGSTYMENDTVTVNLPRIPETQLDPHPFYGRVLYTHGQQLDHPLGITRIGYVDFKDGTARTVFAPFTVIPGWSLLGDPDRQYVAEPNVSTCILGSDAPCVYVEHRMRWWAYGAPARLMDHWYGSLIENKMDRTGTFYRRNRYYDAQTGRFTQEDPIGLAGGLNLYGYAGGDPVNFSDPFGLSECPSGQAEIGDGQCATLLTFPGIGPGGRGLVRGLAALTQAVRTARSAWRARQTLSAVRATTNNILRELDRFDHLQAARLENTGRLVTAGDHADELTSFSNSLRTSIVRLKGVLGDPHLPAATRAEVTEYMARLSRLRDAIQQALR